MKVVVVLAVFIAWLLQLLKAGCDIRDSSKDKMCAGNPTPLIPGDNSHYVEGESRYIWMPDGEGVPHLVDLHEEPSDHELLQATRNGANNQYWLFTRQNPTTRQIITNGNANSISSSNYAGNRPLKVIAHGWNNNGNSEVNTMVTAAFLADQNCNVIVVDWSALANSGYTTAINGVPNVGTHIGNFVTWLINTGGGNWNNVHFVGFSLGAHVMGNAGRAVNNRVARITGLDPAGPLWTSNSNALRASDAQYVEAIHTDGRLLGIMNAIGGSNFYPNGGRNPQPGCSISTCSHGRSYQLFAATVRNNHLNGRLCNNLAAAEAGNCSGSTMRMGNAIVSKRGSGIYGLTTGSSFPY